MDDTEKIATELSKVNPNVRLINQLNSGLPESRNNGIRAAQGEFILPLDADDLISPEYIEEAVREFKKNKKLKVVYCNAEFFGEKIGKWDLKEFSRNNLAKDNMIFCSAIYRRSEWERVNGYSKEMNGGWEDWEFWISILKEEAKLYVYQLLASFIELKRSQ